jgi:hypothetical protein
LTEKNTHRSRTVKKSKILKNTSLDAREIGDGDGDGDDDDDDDDDDADADDDDDDEKEEIDIFDFFD